MTTNDEKTHIPKFHDNVGDSFHLWKLRMSAIFHDKGVLDLVNGKVSKPGDTASSDERAAYAKLMARAKALIILGLGDRPLKAVQKHADDPATLWAKLALRYASKTTSTKLMLLNEVFNHRYTAGTALVDHIADMELSFTKLSAAGQDLDELLQVSALLSSLSGIPDYEPTIAAIRTMDEAKATWETVTSRLIDESHERNQASSAEARLAVSAATPAARGPRTGGDKRRGGRGGRRGRGGKGGSKGGGKSGGQPGGSQPGASGQPRLTVLHCDDGSAGEDSTSTATLNVTSGPPDAVDFLIDSGASHHMCCDVRLFSSLENCDEKRIKLGDTREVLCTQKGVVDIEVKIHPDVKPFWLRLINVLCVPALRMNILSVSAMDTSRIRVAFSLGRVELYDTDTRQRLGSGVRQSDGLYWLHAQLKIDGLLHTAMVERNLNPEQLWHARLGHLNQRALRTILADEGYKADPNASPATVDCEDCTEAKGTRGPHDQPLVRPGDSPGTCVFMDLCGPMPTQSWGGGRYLLLFVDGATRYIWHDTLESKSETCDAIERFIANFDATFPHRVRRLHSDNGGEFVNNRVKALLNDTGIAHSLTVPYNPRSNGVVERANRTVVERIRALLISGRLDLRFWAEAAIHAVRTLNVVPKPVLGNISPHEALYKSAPNLSNFRVFGCRAYMPINPAARRKLSPKMHRCILLASGVGNLFRVFEPHTQLLHIVRHVRCNEREIPGYGTPPSARDDITTTTHNNYNRDDHAELAFSDDERDDAIGDTPATEVCDDDDMPDDEAGADVNVPAEQAGHEDVAAAQPAAGGDPGAGPSEQLTDRQREALTHMPHRRSGRIADQPAPDYNEQSDDDNFVDANTASANTLSAQSNDEPSTQHNADGTVTMRHKGKTRVIARGTVEPSDTRRRDTSTGNVRDAYVETANEVREQIALAAMGTVDPDSPSLAQALNSPERNEWLAAIYTELQAVLDRGTLRRVPRPQGKRVLNTKMVLKVKRRPDNSVERYKARLVVLGFQQGPGDFDKTFSPVADFTTVRVFLTGSAKRGEKVHHIDIANAFLYALLAEELYISLPRYLDDVMPGLDLDDASGAYVYQLLRSLYGLRQAPRVWYEHLTSALRKLGLHPLQHAESGFAGLIDGASITVIVYVDDLLVATSCDRALATFKRGLSTHFDMRDFREVSAFLNVAIERRMNAFTLSQRGYVEKILDTFNMRDANPAPTPIEPAKYRALTERRERTDEEAAVMATVPYRKLVGMLLYLSTHTRPDIAFAVAILARHMAAPRPVHWVAGKRILRYLRGTANFALHLGAADLRLSAYADADWAGGADRLSVTGNLVLLGGAPVLWRSAKQPCTALSTTEAEYVSLSTVARDVHWLRRLCRELGMAQDKPTPLYEDNTGAIAWASDIGNFRRNKHIDVRVHHVRELVDSNDLAIMHVPTNEQRADVLTKPHHGPGLVAGRDRLGVRAPRASSGASSSS